MHTKLVILLLISFVAIGCNSTPPLPATESNVMQDKSSEYSIPPELSTEQFDPSNNSSFDTLTKQLDQQISDLGDSDFEDFGSIE